MLAKAIAQMFERYEAGRDVDDPLEYMKRLVAGESEALLLFFSFFSFSHPVMKMQPMSRRKRPMRRRGGLRRRTRS